MKKYFLLISIFIFISTCSSEPEQITFENLSDVSISTTTNQEITGSKWSQYLGKSSYGNFVALRVSEDIDSDRVLIVFTIQELKQGIKDGGKVMNPIDRNVIDKMSILGISSNPKYLNSFEKNLIDREFNVEFNAQGDFHNVDITKIDFSDYFSKYTNGLLPSFYIEMVDNNVLMVGGRGTFISFNLDNGSHSVIETNLNEIIESQNYSSTIDGSDYSSRMGIRDTFFDNQKNELFVTAIKKDENRDCFTLGVLKSNLDSSNNQLKFEWVFSTNDCVENFNSHHAGGRIQKYKNGYLLTVGDFKMPEDFNQEIDKDSHLGKILFINENWKAEIFSSGHRNPQGLFISNETIFSSEHGPFGGDEVNIISEGSFYGWPESAYGFTYGLENVYNLEHDDSSTEPVYFFTPSIGISEILVYQGIEFPRWNNFLFVSSLKNMSIYTMKLSKDGKSIIHVGQTYIGERIRDLNIDSSGKIIIAGDLGNLIIVNKTEKDIP